MFVYEGYDSYDHALISGDLILINNYLYYKAYSKIILVETPNIIFFKIKNSNIFYEVNIGIKIQRVKCIKNYKIICPNMCCEQNWKQLGNRIVGRSGVGEATSLNYKGDIVAVGDYDGINDSGQVRVYKWSGLDWNQIGQDINGEADNDYSGSSVSLNSEGNIIAIGAYGNDGNGNDSGHVRIWKFDEFTSSWVQIGQDINGEAINDYSGMSVSLNSEGNIVAIGSYRNGTFSGHVRVWKYDMNSSLWIQIGQDIDGEATGDFSGWSVSLNSEGNIVAIGAIGNDDNGVSSGHVRVWKYDMNSSLWVQIGQDIDGEATFNNSGYSVSLNSEGNIIAIGAPGNGDNGTDSGHVRVWKLDTNSSLWVQMGQDIDGEAAVNYSGWSVGLNSEGNIIAIGAYGNETNSGHIRVWKWSGTTSSWIQIGQDIDGKDIYDSFGISVSINSEGTIVAGGQYNDTEIYKFIC